MKCPAFPGYPGTHSPVSQWPKNGVPMLQDRSFVLCKLHLVMQGWVYEALYWCAREVIVLQI